MKTLLQYLFFVIVCTFSFVLSAQNNFETPVKSKKAKQKYFSNIIEKFGSPKTKYIWKSREAKDMFYYTDGETEGDIYEDGATIIHEFYHGLNHMEKQHANFVINEDLTIHVPVIKIFPSNEINQMIPKSRQDSIFRYGIYVGKKNEITGLGESYKINTSDHNEAYSIRYGIFGLMEEFAAYDAGFNSVSDMYSLFESHYAKNDTSLWSSYFESTQNGEIAFHEFQLFIALYLTYSKTNYPEQYLFLKKNNELRALYTIISENYLNNLNDINKKRVLKNRFIKTPVQETINFDGTFDDRVNLMMMSGFSKEEIYEDSTYIDEGVEKSKKTFILEPSILKQLNSFYNRIRAQINPEGSNGLMLYFTRRTQQVEYLKKLMTPALKKELENFKIEGCNTENIKEYLQK